MFLALLLFIGSAQAQQMPTGPIQIIKDNKTVKITVDTLNPLNNVFMPVVATALPLPTGAATEAKQDVIITDIGTANSYLSSIDTKLDGPIPVTGTFSDPAVGLTGATVPTSASLSGADKSGVLTALKMDAGENLLVNVTTSALPANAATEAKQDIGNASLSSIDTKITAVDTDNVTITNSVLPTGAATEVTLSSIDTKTPSLVSGRVPVDGSGVTQPVSGTVTVSNPGLTDSQLRASAVPVSVSSLPLPTGAATEVTLSSIDGKIANDYGVSTGAVRTASQIGNASGVADFGSGNSSAQTIRTVIATDQSAIATKAPISTTGSGSAASATVSTVITLTKPSNAIGFVLMNLDTSTANIRWALGRTATTTLGQQLQPGRDTGFIPASVDISLVAESGTQNYDVQWVSQ